MKRSVMAGLIGLILGSTASAGVIATGAGFFRDVGNVECLAVNIGTKPVTVTSMALIDGVGTVYPFSTSNCTFPGQISPGLMCKISLSVGSNSGLARYFRCVIDAGSKSKIRGTMLIPNTNGDVVLEAH
jgi:hypothetical protein